MKIGTSRPVASHRPVVHGGWEGDGGDGGDGGRKAAGGRGSGGGRPGIIDFSSNVGPAGVPPSVIPALGRGLGRIAHYPDTRCTELAGSLAGYTGLPRANLVVGNGAVDLIYGFCGAFLPGRRVLIPVPTFGEYEAAARLAGCGPIAFLKTMNLADDADSLASRIPDGGCVFICNPNNPTGGLLSRRQLAGIVSQARRRSCLVFVDECFIEMVPGRPSQSVLPLVGGRGHGNLFVLRSLTKSFGLAGIRVGYAAGPKRMVAALQRTRIPWSVNALAQRAGLLAIRDAPSHIKRTKSIISAESRFLREMISGIDGFECHDSSANFILVRTEQDSAVLREGLLRRHGILVRDCRSFRGLGSHHIRIAVRRHPDNVRLVRALEAAAG